MYPDYRCHAMRRNRHLGNNVLETERYLFMPFEMFAMLQKVDFS
jgi:hypothetical protein